MILLLVKIWRFGQIHFSDRIEEPLLLDVLQVIPVCMLVQRVDGGEDLWTERTLEPILGLFLFLLLLVVRVRKKHFLVRIEEPELLDLVDVVAISVLGKIE